MFGGPPYFGRPPNVHELPMDPQATPTLPSLARGTYVGYNAASTEPTGVAAGHKAGLTCAVTVCKAVGSDRQALLAVTVTPRLGSGRSDRWIEMPAANAVLTKVVDAWG